MKLAFSTMVCPDWTLDQIIQAARRYGYAGVEFRCDGRQNHGLEVYADRTERTAIRRKLEKAGLEICCLASGVRMLNALEREILEERLKLAADAGAPGVRVFAGRAMEDWSQEEFIEQLSQVLAQAAERAERYGLELWLETHDSVSRAAVAAEAVRKAGHTSVGLVYDNLHPYRSGESLQETMKALKGLIRHVHFHDGLKRPDQVVIRPIGQGELPLPQMWQALTASGYQGYICGEWFGKMYGMEPAEALKRYAEEITRLAQGGDQRADKAGP